MHSACERAKEVNDLKLLVCFLCTFALARKTANAWKECRGNAEGLVIFCGNKPQYVKNNLSIKMLRQVKPCWELRPNSTTLIPAAKHIWRLHGTFRTVEPSRLFVGHRPGHLALPSSPQEYQCGRGRLSERKTDGIKYEYHRSLHSAASSRNLYIAQIEAAKVQQSQTCRKIHWLGCMKHDLLCQHDSHNRYACWNQG